MAGYRRGLRLRPGPDGDVVVVTGATGPVGRPVALALAARGLRAVLVDDASTDLEALAVTCGPTAAAVAADVTDPADVEHAAAEAVRRCGRIDGWVQCGGAGRVGGGGPVGSLLDVGLDELRHVLDADLLGAVHGARAAVPHLSGGGGVLVVVASVHGQVARPFGAPEGMAGAGIRVMAAALRQELPRNGVRGVAVTTVLMPAVLEPAALGPAALEPTGGTARPGSTARTDRPTGRPFPSVHAERAAATVLRQLRHPRLEKVAGGPLTTALVHGHALVPAATEWLVAQRSPRPDGAGRASATSWRGTSWSGASPRD